MSRAVRTVVVTALTVALGVATAFTRGQEPAQAKPDLANPAAFTEKAPDTYVARFDTTAGAFAIRVTRSWAPNGADRFYNLVKAGFYDECRFFRYVPGVMVQFGIHGDPAVQAAWNKAALSGDRARSTNTRGRISFATRELATTMSTQVIINLGDNSKKMDAVGFAPFGEVITGMVMVDRVFSKYGDGPDPKRLFAEGNAYIEKNMPYLDHVKTATIDK